MSLEDEDMIDMMNRRQTKYTPNPFIFDKTMQPHLNWKMRALLVDWMIELSAEFDLRRETFYLAYNYLDRFLNNVKNVEKKYFQLIGTAALYLACKVEEIFTPKLEYFIIATDRGYNHEQILGMERKL